MSDIKDEFFKRLNRAHIRAKETAQRSTLNRDAWLQQVNDLVIIRRLVTELGIFTESTEHKAQTRHAAALEQAEIDVDQAEDLANAKLIADNAGLFVANDVGTVKKLLEKFDPTVFAEAWRRLKPERQRELMQKETRPWNDR